MIDCRRCRMRTVWFVGEIYCEVCLSQKPWALKEAIE